MTELLLEFLDASRPEQIIGVRPEAQSLAVLKDGDVVLAGLLRCRDQAVEDGELLVVQDFEVATAVGEHHTRMPSGG
ncbi:MAG: hypothetical protein AUG49_24055 [Catenulispora sp. 13_1_20CM_3_70_7]|nr:MAG: hypothetical protein AUG49_24055 [Catenulispora sp. 13_1_20CM_3_70_7]